MCMSQSLTRKMRQYTAGGKFLALCVKMKRPDDVTLGFISEGLLNVPLTVMDDFHSHLEPLKARTFDLQHQITLSHWLPGSDRKSILVPVKGFDLTDDPTR